MKKVGDVTIESDKITTPDGHFPLSSTSAVWVRPIRRKQYSKKALALGLFAVSVATGGTALLAFAAGVTLAHQSYEVVTSTNGVEFVVYQFDKVLSVVYNKSRAGELKDAIATTIMEKRS